MTARQRFSAYRDWRRALAVGQEVGILRLRGNPSSGRVVRTGASMVRVRDRESDYVYHFPLAVRQRGGERLHLPGASGGGEGGEAEKEEGAEMKAAESKGDSDATGGI